MADRIPWTSFDPHWLVELAEAQKPEIPWLAEALRQCVKAQISNDINGSVYFVDRMEGKFSSNIILLSKNHGKVVLDILKDGRVGGYSIIEMGFEESSE